MKLDYFVRFIVSEVDPNPDVTPLVDDVTVIEYTNARGQRMAAVVVGHRMRLVHVIGEAKDGGAWTTDYVQGEIERMIGPASNGTGYREALHELDPVAR